MYLVEKGIFKEFKVLKDFAKEFKEKQDSLKGITNSKEYIRNKKIELGKKSFREYALLRNPDFFKKERTYQEDICNAMQLAYEKKLINPNTGKPFDILIINEPPGFGKSYTASTFITWVYGQDKKAQVIAVSYNQTLSLTFSKSVREAINDTEIKTDDNYFVPTSFFPDLKIKYGDAAMERWSLEGSYMSYLATSFDGSITGMRGNIGIIDDPIKDAKEAVNESVKDAIWDFYKNTFSSRMLDGALIIVIQTRWATDDLAGRLLTNFPDRCFELKLAALDSNNRSICEDLYSTEDLLTKKNTLDEDIWNANYMQIPVDRKGSLYKEFKTYDILDMDMAERVINYTDTADEGADYLCSITAVVIGGYAYVVDIYYTDESMEVTENEVARRLQAYQVRESVIESNNGGRGFARNVLRILKTVLKAFKCQVMWFTQTKNKKTRIIVNASNVMEQVIMPEGWQKKYSEFYKAISKYQRKGKNEHDDAPDALTGLVEVVNGDIKVKKKARLMSKKELGL